ncbi:MAG TPA: Mrp/NBP35 family ATP-binding protein [Thermoleophilia bacterium]|nr:Mrp/NBP35 family ATP-binding protein [Thermoleophilia bacterium]
MPSDADIRTALAAVIDPELRRSVVELDMVRGVTVAGGDVSVTLALTVAGCPMKANLEQQVRAQVSGVDGVERIEVAFDVMSAEERTALRARLGASAGESKQVALPARTRVVAIASGKGGVGKSTLTANLAVALAQTGSEVGVIDADIYGYSIPRMLGVSRRPVVVDRMIVPPVNHDVRFMSIGFFVDDDRAVVWRGPMLHRALEQFLTDVHWGELDYLLVDMPPGTGDVSISLGQLLPSPDLVIVTTPQPAAQRVAARAAEVAAKTGMRVAGVVENMSYTVCSCCGERTYPFGRDGGRLLADELAVPLLAQVPLDEPLREASDNGTPLVVSSPDAASAQAISALATAVKPVLRPRSGADRIRRPLQVMS